MAAFVSNGPGWCCVSPFLSTAGFVFGFVRTRRRGDVFEFMFYISTDVLIVKSERGLLGLAWMDSWDGQDGCVMCCGGDGVVGLGCGWTATWGVVVKGGGVG